MPIATADSAADSSPERGSNRRGPQRLLLAAGILTVALAAFGGVHDWRQARTDAFTRARFAQLRSDPLISAFNAQFGRPRTSESLLRCHNGWDGPTPPRLEEIYRTPFSPGALRQAESVAKGAGWKVSVDFQEPDSADVDLDKSFGDWDSRSDVYVDRTGLTLDLTASDGDHCA